jgi:hypothetical protein
MAALGLRFRAWLRRRRGFVLVAALLIGLVAGLAMGLVAGTRRTASAPDRYTMWAGGDPDLEIVQQGGDPLVQEAASLPGVRRASGITFVTSFLRGPDGSIVFRPNPFAGSDRIGGARVVEGRHTNPAQPDEFTVNQAMADLVRRRFDSHVGDSFDVVSFARSQVETNRAFTSGDPPAVPPFPAKWVGVIQNPTDFEEATPSIYYSEAFLRAHPTVGVVQSIMQLHLADGTDREQVLRAVQSLPGGASAFTTGARIVSDESRRAVRFQATALWIVTAITLIGAAIVTMQLISRSVRRSEHEVRTLASLGLRSRDLAVERILEALVCTVTAVPVALLVARAVAERFPLGALRAFEPHPGPLLDWTVIGVGFVTMLLTAIAGALIATSGDREDVTRRRRAAQQPVTLPKGGMPLTVGAHYARIGPSGAGRSIVSVVAGMVGMAGLVGAVIVGLNLDDMVNTPARWGVNYDELFGNPYVETDTDIVTPVANQRGVAQVTAVHIGSLTIDGRETPTLAIDPVKGELVPDVLKGRVPSAGAEIGLGEEVAHRLGVGVGDSVVLGGSTDSERHARVVGIVVTPDSAGGGAAVPFALYRALNPSATRNVLLTNFVPGTQDDVIRPPCPPRRAWKRSDACSLHRPCS